jgi:glycosyltransferase involved in cell wall biosynthesis
MGRSCGSDDGGDPVLNDCILFDSTDIFGKRIGGAETFLKGLVKYAPADLSISVVGTTSDPVARPIGQWQQLSFSGRPIHYLPVVSEEDENQKSRIPLSLRYTYFLQRYSIDTRAKVLFFNRIEPSILYRAQDCTKVIMVHNDVLSQLMRKNASETVWSRFPYLYRLFERYAIRNVDHLYTVSEASLKYYHSVYKDIGERASFLPTCLDPELFYPSSEPKFHIRQRLHPDLDEERIRCKWILFVGRLQEQKAPLRLLEVFRRFREGDSTSMLVIVGDGNLREKTLLEAQRLGLRERIIHIGFLEQPGLADYYRAADALLLVSNYEGMPISVLEALGCGLPVVSTRVGEVPRVVKDGLCGELVTTFEPDTIAKAVTRVVQSPAQYSRNNCVNAVQDFMPSKVIHGLFNGIAEIHRRKWE